MKHGGDLLSYKEYYDGELVDYSSNINPLGMPEGLEKVLADSFKELEAYPDIKYRRLKKSVGDYLKCKEPNIVFGNGAVELIDNFIFLAKRVLIWTPSFLEYEERALIRNKEVIKIPYKDDFTIDLSGIGAIIQEGDMLVLGNPNNPTGLRIKEEELFIIYEIIKKKNGFLLLDEAFFEFCPEDYDSIELFREVDYEKIGIIRAATKFFALPGIRLGYGCTSEKMARKIEEIQLPWSINTLAEVAGNYIFHCKKYMEESKRYIEKERTYLLEELSKIKFIKTYATTTNYILIHLLTLEEEDVFQFFLHRGIIIRKCSSFRGLNNNFIRIAIKDRENNKRLLEIFKELGKQESANNARLK